MNNEKYAQWIRVLAELQGGRPGYSDQQPESIAALVKLAERTNPTKVVEIGTSYGLSLRAWLEIPSIEVIAIDMFFNPLWQSHKALPFDTNRVDTIEADIMSVNLPALWEPDDCVILYFDCHGANQMSYTLTKAVPFLPKGSVVAVDDMWYSPEILDENNLQAFLSETVLPQIDEDAPHGLRPSSYAPYWKGGSFFSFDEVTPLMAYLAGNSIPANFEPGIKFLWWQV